MNLYIQVKDGQCVKHPAFEENLIEAFGVIPDDWEPFVRKERPVLGEYETLINLDSAYQKIEGVWTDVWEVREMTAEEKAEVDAKRLNLKIQAIKNVWTNRKYASNFTAWVFDETKMSFVPPIPRPDDGKFYRWSGPDNNWKEADPFPQDGKQYEFDFDNWVNVEITNV